MWTELAGMADAFDARYGYPWVLWLLCLVPLLAIFELWPRRTRHGPMDFPGLATLQAAGRGWRVWLLPVPRVLRLAALALLLVALARPQTHEREERRVEGIDIYVILDMSGSMQAVDLNLAEVDRMLLRGDTPSNRFQNAAAVLREFIEGRRERCNNAGRDGTLRCDRIGMVVFGKDAFLEFPLTLDYGTILTLLAQRELGDIDGSGTALGNALARAVAGLRHSNARSKVAVLITDGDRRGGDISPAQAASMAKHFGVNAFPVLVGREGPTLLPSGFDAFGLRSSYQQVQFPVNPQLLEKIATMTGGHFYRATDSDSLKRDLHDILDKFERTEMEGTVNVSTTEHYQPFALGAIMLLALEAGLAFLVIRKFP